MKLWKIAVLLFVISLLSFSLITIPLSKLKDVQVDNSAMNHIINQCSINWNTRNFSSLQTSDFEFTILDNQGTILYQTSGSRSLSIYDGIRNADIMVDIPGKENTILGKAIFENQLNQQIANIKNQLTFSLITFAATFTLIAIIYLAYINYKILKPFSKLKIFSSNIARGNFDSPLLMDKQNIFGSFTESFDIMREELLKSKENERLATQSKKELIACLSHDIKTPVATIIAVSEVMLLKAELKEQQDKLNIIIKKAEQINALISDMFHATLEELETLSISPVPIHSKNLIKMIENADYEKLVVLKEISECVIVCDPLRLQQVFDNIISNSYKYANTEIKILSKIIDDKLQISFTDSGDGIAEDELPLIFGKFYRGKNSEGKSGAGLGLSISHYIISKMGGEIFSKNIPNGFQVFLTVRLA